MKHNSTQTITWVTPDYFVDCDFNPDLFAGILKQFKIHWIILLPTKNARFSESEFENIRKLEGLTLEFIYWSVRARSPKMLFFYERIYNRIKQLNSDLVYFNYVPTSPYVLPLYWRLSKTKTIVTAHDGNVKPSFHIPWLAKAVFNMAFSTKKYVNTFSDTERKLFLNTFNRAESFLIPLALKDFGPSNKNKRTDHIIFLFFGSIHSNKNLSLLIEAANNLYKKGIRGFKVSINGFANDWAVYEAKIECLEVFECDIRLHKNSEIPDLFSTSHYAVFPYKEMSQSGALKVAFNYNLPVIVSDLPGFTNEVKSGINGYVFKSDVVEDLERIMVERINNHAKEYPSIQERVINYNAENYATVVLSNKYLKMFNEVLSKQN